MVKLNNVMFQTFLTAALKDVSGQMHTPDVLCLVKVPLILSR